MTTKVTLLEKLKNKNSSQQKKLIMKAIEVKILRDKSSKITLINSSHQFKMKTQETVSSMRHHLNKSL
jgi:hypothetical protein